MNVLERIDQLKAELDALRPLDAEREGRIMQKFRLDWNYHSNHLEGNSLTYGETKALILFGITAQGKPLKDHLEMTGHNEAIKWIEEVIKEARPLTENFIRQLHELLLKEPYQVDALTPGGQPTKKWIQVGQYKSSPNNVVTVTGEIFYFATPEETPAMMTDLVDWYRGEREKGELHPLQLAALFHYRFVRIHPFDDGNGRTARILMNFILMQHGLPPVIIKTEDKDNYFAALRQADAGLLEPFVEYIGENLERSLDLMVRGAKGESIDEKDDVDKEIALLEQRLNALGTRIYPKKSSEVLLNVIDKAIIPLTDFYLNQSDKFSSFYRKIIIYYNVSYKDYFSRILKKEIEELVNIDGLKRIISNSKNSIFKVLVTCKFESFNRTGIEEFDYSSYISFVFTDSNSYKVSSNNQKIVFEKFYDEYLSENEIIELIRNETKVHTAFIEQKIEEAQRIGEL